MDIFWIVVGLLAAGVFLYSRNKKNKHTSRPPVSMDGGFGGGSPSDGGDNTKFEQ